MTMLLNLTCLSAGDVNAVLTCICAQEPPQVGDVRTVLDGAVLVNVTCLFLF